MPATLRTTLELPAPLIRRAKIAAVEHHTSLKEVVTEALSRYLASEKSTKSKDPEWMKWIGKTTDAEADEMQRIVAGADFSKVNPEDWK